MTVSLVVTLNGIDRPGVIARVADCANARSASWQQSAFTHLAGRFAGVVLLTVADDAAVTALERALRELESADLHLTLERGGETARPVQPRVELELIGQDRPGIVREIAAVLARHEVSIDELETGVESASMSGESLFHAHATLLLPADIDIEALTLDLEKIADELMVDLELDGVNTR